MKREDLVGRQKAYERERFIVSIIGFLPLLVIYVLTHTRFLGAVSPADRSAALVRLLLLPMAWFAAVMLLHRWIGPVGQKLKCPACQRPLVRDALREALDTGRCGGCGGQVVADVRDTPPAMRP